MSVLKLIKANRRDDGKRKRLRDLHLDNDYNDEGENKRENCSQPIYLFALECYGFLELLKNRDDILNIQMGHCSPVRNR
jgi:hypothetical protein